MKKFIASLKSFHIDIGCNHRDIDDVFSHGQVERIFQGVKRTRGTPATQRRSPLTRDILLRLLTTCDMRTNAGANYHAAFCLAFAGFFRLGEITYENSDIWDPEFGLYLLGAPLRSPPIVLL